MLTRGDLKQLFHDRTPLFEVAGKIVANMDGYRKNSLNWAQDKDMLCIALEEAMITAREEGKKLAKAGE